MERSPFNQHLGILHNDIVHHIGICYMHYTLNRSQNFEDTWFEFDIRCQRGYFRNRLFACLGELRCYDS